MAVFRIDYDRAIEQAEDIRALASDFQSEISDLETLLSRIKREWRGPASDAFTAQLNMLITEMKTTKNDMTRVSDLIKSTAKEIQREDEKAASKD